MGSGVGYVLSKLMKDSRISKLLGVEINSEFAWYGSDELAKLESKVSGIEIHVANILNFIAYDKPTLFYMYLPFGENTFEAMIRKIRFSQRVNPRSVRIVFYGLTDWLGKFLSENEVDVQMITEDMVFWDMVPEQKA